jgi:hypothetical protein
MTHVADMALAQLLLLLLLLLQAGEGGGKLPLDGNIPDMHATTE